MGLGLLAIAKVLFSLFLVIIKLLQRNNEKKGSLEIEVKT